MASAHRARHRRLGRRERARAAKGVGVEFPTPLNGLRLNQTTAEIRRAPLETGNGVFQRANALSAALMRRRGAVLGLSLASLPVIAAADLSTGYELPLSLAYVAPVVASTWAFGLRAGLALSVLATAAWLATDLLTEHRYSLPIYRLWEGGIRLATFGLFAAIIEQLKRALARSDERLIKVLEGLDAAVCVLDPGAGSILYRNRPFDAAFPGTAREAAAQRLLEAALAEGSGEEAEELQLGAAWFLVRARWLRWIDERPVLLLSATDVTARRSAEMLNREHEARLQSTARLAAVGEIASSIAHELNQPLAAIASYVSGCVRRLRSGESDPRALAGALDQAREQAERAGRIIQRVRDYVRSRQPVLAALDLNGVVARAVAVVAHEAERSGARIVLRPRPALPLALGDSVMLEHVILNLVQNALDAPAAGRAARVVEVTTARADPDALQVTVADNGPGIPQESAARVFEPFYTSKPEGMGLGLNICRSIVEFHGGRLWTTPGDAGGAQFHFTLREAPREGG